MRHRVVVTGMGVVTPIGCTVADFERNLFAGISGVGPVTVFDPGSLPTRIAAEVKLDIPVPDRKLYFAEQAAAQAMANPPRSPGGGLSLAVGLELFDIHDLVSMGRPGFTLPTALADRLFFLQTPADIAVHRLCVRNGLATPPLTHVSACAAGADAIGTGFHLVASGRRRWVLAGGTDSMVNPLGMAGFCKIRAMTLANHRMAKASRPFDLGRDGFVLGEGAGFVLLETLQDALARNAPIHAEIAGYGSSLDADEISRPHPEGRGALQAMQRALLEAGIGPDDVDAINAHGTSTPLNDLVETLAIKRLLGERAHRVPVSAPKSMIGHLISAAGAVEAVATILGLQSQRVHPTAHLENPDPECDLDYVPGHARDHAQTWALSNAFGFGGQNACLVFRRSTHATG